MNLKDILATAHHLVEAKEHRRISQAEMAERLGISPRSYAEYLHGREPPGMVALVALLRMLPEGQVEEVLRKATFGSEAATMPQAADSKTGQRQSTEAPDSRQPLFQVIS